MKIGDEGIYARTHAEFLNTAFGTNYKAWMRTVWNYGGILVWMVRFDGVVRDGWRNKFLSDDCIIEENLNKNKTMFGGKPISESIEKEKKRAVFEITGNGAYRRYTFRGLFVYDNERSNDNSIHYYNKVSDEL